MRTVLWSTAGVFGAGLVALLVVEIVHRIVVRLGRRSALLAELADKAHRPLQVLVPAYAVQLAVRALVRSFPGRAEVLHVVAIALIAAVAWLVGTLLLVVEDAALARFRTDVRDNLRQRRLHTQVVMVRRVTVAAVAVLAAGVVLMTFPEIRAVGASVLASAGVIGVIAALAAQSMLSNVFAGLQLTFSDAIRLDDVVVVEDEWGKIEEITLSHVVVRIWDDRRLILPTSYFTTKPFENWTRSSAALLGTVEFEVDWAVPVSAVRDELRRLVEDTELWDGRVCVLQVTDALGGAVRLRALVSATDAPTLWDLRCLVREHLVGWLRDRYPDALPRLRAEVGSAGDDAWTRAPAGVDLGGTRPTRPVPAPAHAPAAAGTAPAPASISPAAPAPTSVSVPAPTSVSVPATATATATASGDGARVFGGSHEGHNRGQDFVGPEDGARSSGGVDGARSSGGVDGARRPG